MGRAGGALRDGAVLLLLGALLAPGVGAALAWAGCRSTSEHWELLALGVFGLPGCAMAVALAAGLRQWPGAGLRAAVLLAGAVPVALAVGSALLRGAGPGGAGLRAGAAALALGLCAGAVALAARAWRGAG